MTIRNIDIDPATFEMLTNMLEKNDIGDETKLLLLHQRKSELMGGKQRADLLELVKLQVDQLQHVSAKIQSVHLIDCSGGGNSLHSEFSLLGDLLTVISSSFDQETTAGVVLLDYVMPQDSKTGLLESQIEIRNLLDPSVYADSADQAMQVMVDIREKMDSDTLSKFDKELRIQLENFVHQAEERNTGL